MGKLSAWRNKILFRMTVAFFSCVFLPILIFLVFGFLYVGNITSRTQSRYLEDALLEFEQSYRTQLLYYDNVVADIAKSEALGAYLASPDDAACEEQVYRYLNDFTGSQSGTYHSIRVWAYGQADYRLDGFANASQVDQENWWIEFFADRVVEAWSSDPARTDTSLIKLRRLYDRSGREIGVLRVEFDLPQIVTAAAYRLRDRKEFFAITPDGAWVYAAQGAGCRAEIQRRADDFQQTLYRIRPGIVSNKTFGRYRVALMQLQDFDLILASSVDRYARGEGYGTFTAFAVFTFLILTVFTAIFYYYVIRIISTIKRDVGLVEEYVEYNLGARLQVRRHDEIGEIEQQYNALLDKIERLTQNILQKEKKRKHAEIAMLQNQLNPHFIYNSINYFRMQLELNGDVELADSIAKFGKLIRYNMMTRDYLTTLQQELATLQYYVDLELLRFSNRLEYELDCPPGVGDVKVPKSILQPILENSIKYGKQNDRVLHLRVTIRTQGNDLHIVIRDDGVGASPAAVRSLNSQFESGYYIAASGQGPSTRIGLKNINQRLCLIYDDTYHISVASEQGEFFEVRLRIPMEWQ